MVVHQLHSSPCLILLLGGLSACQTPAATNGWANLTRPALIGRGIRSATFQMGMIQTLHHMERLPKTDPLGIAACKAL